MDIRANIIVKGRVQGVGFRYFTLNEARMLGLKGNVTNLFSGEVKVIVEGNKSAILTLIKSLRIGPRFSSVQNVLVEFVDFQGEFSDFNIV